MLIVCQARLFAEKTKQKKNECLLLQNLLGVLKVKIKENKLTIIDTLGKKCYT